MAEAVANNKHSNSIAVTNNTETTLLAAPQGTSHRHYVQRLSVWNKHATNDCVLTFRDGAGGNVVYQANVKAGQGFIEGPLHMPLSPGNPLTVQSSQATSDLLINAGSEESR